MRKLILGLILALLAIPAKAQVVSGSITAGGADCTVTTRCVEIPMGGQGSTVMAHITGTWTATLVAEVSADRTTWVTTDFFNVGTVGYSSTLAANATVKICGTPGAAWARIRASAYTSGTVVVAAYAAPGREQLDPLHAGALGLTAPFNGGDIVEKGPRLKVVSTPAVSTLASASASAGAAGVRHVADCVSFSAGSTTAPVLTKLNINLRDGASGAGTILMSWTVVIPAATGQNVAPFSVCGLNLPGSAATAMTLEFSSLLANLFEDVTLTYYDVN